MSTSSEGTFFRVGAYLRLPLSLSVDRVTNMRMLHQQDITPHYVKTLQHWRFEFMNKLGRVKSLGYDDAFIRLWHFYLCYCEAAFAWPRFTIPALDSSFDRLAHQPKHAAVNPKRMAVNPKRRVTPQKLARNLLQIGLI